MTSFLNNVVSFFKRAAAVVADVVSKFIDDMAGFLSYAKDNTKASVQGEFGSIGYLNVAFLLLALITLGPLELVGIFLLGAAGYAVFMFFVRGLADQFGTAVQAGAAK
jgi:hypothetical protein